MGYMNAQQFVEDIRNDPDLNAAFSACAGKAERQALAEARGYRFTPEELAAAGLGFSEDDDAGIIFQESQLGYDSDAGHGGKQNPDPNYPRDPGPDEPQKPS